VGAASVRGDDLEPDLREGNRLLCIRNSWGAGWGVDGHKLISEDAVNECAIIGLALDDLRP
jgi:C1A family cysteine protease